MVTSPEVTVTIGSAYKLIFKQTIGNAFGGETFSSFPIVAVADKGNNHITTLNRGSITANLLLLSSSVQSGNNTILLRPTSNLTQEIKNGAVKFDFLYINEAAKEYQIRFDCSYVSESLYSTLPETIFIYHALLYRQMFLQ